MMARFEKNEVPQKAPAEVSMAAAAPVARQVRVRAIPAQGHAVRRRAGRAWPETWTIVEVADNPSGDQISYLQLAQLEADPRIAVAAVGSLDSLDTEAKMELALAQDEVERLRKRLAQETENLEAERKQSSKALEHAGDQLRALEAQVAELRAQAAK
jgi:hypothetical protein